MGMIANFLNSVFNRKTEIVNESFSNIETELYVNELAFNICTNLVANAISKCELVTYKDHKRTKGDEWYMLNIEPNVNQNATQFYNKLIYKLYDEGHALCLIFRSSATMYVADSFTVDESNAFRPHTFSNIQIDGLSLNATYSLGKNIDVVCLYFKLNNNNIRNLTNNVMNLYAKLIKTACSNYYASNGNKGFIHISKLAEGSPKFKEKIENMFKRQFKTFFNSENGVMPLYEGFSYEPYNGNTSTNDSRDITALVKDTLEMYATAFNIPKVLVTGDFQDTSNAMDELLTLCIDPLIELLSDEINRSLFEKESLLSGEYVRFDTTAIKHVDLLDVATAVDKLISSGFACINDIRRVCHMDVINEDWADKFFMTKNYTSIESLSYMDDPDDGGKETE